MMCNRKLNHSFKSNIYYSALFILTLLLSGCAETELVVNQSKNAARPEDGVYPYKVGKPYQVDGVWYYPKVDYEYDETGIASWYGPGFDGKQTASGEAYDQNAMTAAHKTLPMPSLLRVTNLENGRSIVVRVNDRGPFVNNRIIDMSRRGAQLLGFDQKGTARVRLQILKEESQMLAARGQSLPGSDSADAQPQPQAAPAGIVTAQTLPPIKQQPATPSVSATSTASSASAANVSTGSVPASGGGTPPVAQAKATPLPGASATTNPSPDSSAAATPAMTASGKPIIPTGEVSIVPVTATNIYIQAGAFVRQANADLLSSKLNGFAPTHVIPVLVGQQQFFRVRMGPIASVSEADQLLQHVIQSGYPEARIIVD